MNDNPKDHIKKRKETKDAIHNKYSFTTPVTLDLSCKVSGKDLKHILEHGEHGAFFTFEHLIEGNKYFKEYMTQILKTHHVYDDDMYHAFFMDRVTVKDVQSCCAGLHKVGMSVELPYIKHTNTLAYRVVDTDHTRFRAIDLGHEKFTFCHSPQQAVIVVNNQDKSDLLNEDMLLNLPVDFGEHTIDVEDESPDVVRTRLLHILDVLDHKKCYPTKSPKQSQMFIQQNGLKNKVHLPSDSYPATWVDVNENELKAIGVCLDADEYASIAHNFFEHFSNCRFGDFTNTGLFCTFDGDDKKMASKAGDVTFTLEMVVKFIVMKPDTSSEGYISQSTKSAIETAKKCMAFATDANRPFET